MGDRTSGTAWSSTWTLLAALALLLGGCGGGGGPSGGSSGVSQLSVQVDRSGLPANLTPSVTVTGEGVNQTLSATTTLTLANGTYSLAAPDRPQSHNPIVPSEAYGATLSNASVTLSGGTTAVGVSYHSTSTTRMLVPTYDVGLLVLTAQDLAVAGSASTQLFNMESFTGVTIAADGRVYLSDYADATIAIVTFGGSAANVTASRVGSFSANDPNWGAPLALASTSAGDLWVLVTGDDDVPGRLLRFTAANLATVSGDDAVLAVNAVIALPPSGSSADPTRADIFDLAVDAADRLWLADNLGERVLRYDAPSHGASPSAAILNSSDTLNEPTTLVLDGDGRLYVATDDHVARFDTPLTSMPAWPGGALAPNATIAPDRVTPGGANRPDTLALDASGALWIGYLDEDGSLLRILDPQLATSDALVSVERTMVWTLGTSSTPPVFGGNALFIPPVTP